MDHPKTMQGETMTTAQAVAAIERIIVAAVTLCDGLVRAVGEMKREREALQKTIGQMEHEANTQHAAALDLQAQRDAAQEKLAEYEGENKRWHSFETVQAIVKQRDAAIADARKLAQNWNGVMTSVEIEAIVKKYLSSKRA